MVNPKELSALAVLTESLDAGGEKLTLRLMVSVRRALKDKTLSRDDIATVIANGILKEAGNHASAMGAFLRESLSLDEVRFANPDVQGVFFEAAEIVDQVNKVKSIGPVERTKGTLTDYVMKTIDNTQKEYSRSRGITWIRQVEAGACDWCRREADNYDGVSWPRRHKNCKCVNVRA